jgi:hypothetical protein
VQEQHAVINDEMIATGDARRENIAAVRSNAAAVANMSSGNMPMICALSTG